MVDVDPGSDDNRLGRAHATSINTVNKEHVLTIVRVRFIYCSMTVLIRRIGLAVAAVPRPKGRLAPAMFVAGRRDEWWIGTRRFRGLGEGLSAWGRRGGGS